MRILLLSTAFNGLSQRAQVELEDLGHEVHFSLALSPELIRRNVQFFQPQLIICPFLKEKVPEDIWRQHTCLIVHPGIKGDRGPSSLDWAIMNGEKEWGVTVLQAVEEMDAGDIWASETFLLREGGKASVYRSEVTNAAIKAIINAVNCYQNLTFQPDPLDYANPAIRGELRPLMQQTTRRIDWKKDGVDTIIKKINAADSFPGVLDNLYGQNYYLYGAHRECLVQSWECGANPVQPGDIVGQRQDAILRVAVDGLVWISHLKEKPLDGDAFFKRLFENTLGYPIKLPAAKALGTLLKNIPELPIDPLYMGSRQTFHEIWYEERNEVGYLHFDFHNGAMGTEQCQRLLEAYQLAAARSTKVLVLMGGREFWSNGIHLNLIEAAEDSSEESWRNINAIDDFVQSVITTTNKIIVSAIWGGCGAGGAMAILAADQIWARQGVIFNPHYRLMGLYGSEYWTYLLPRRVGPLKALELTEKAAPLGTRKAMALGYIDAILPNEYNHFLAEVRTQAEAIALAPHYASMLADKAAQRQHDEQLKPLADYRKAELEKMKMNFAGKFFIGGVNYHDARHNFVYKVKPKETSPCQIKRIPYELSRLEELRLASSLG